MKKSKMIIAASAILLGVAGALTTKGSNRLANNASFITEATGNACIAYATTCTGGTARCHTAGGGEALFTYAGTGTPKCQNALNLHP
jgi:hypothetical protein